MGPYSGNIQGGKCGLNEGNGGGKESGQNGKSQSRPRKKSKGGRGELKRIGGATSGERLIFIFRHNGALRGLTGGKRSATIQSSTA